MRYWPGALVVCALLAPAVASAAEWTPVTSAGAGGGPAIAADAAGNLGLAFEADAGGIAGSARPRGGPFGATAALSPDGEEPSIAANGAGALFAAWSADAERVEFASGTTTAGFGELGGVPNPGDSPSDVTAGIDNAGDQAIAWVVEDGFVRVSTRAPGGAFSPPATISAADAESPLLSMAPAGAAFVVWLRRTESTSGGTTTAVTRVERAQIGGPGVATLATATLRTDDDGVADGAEVREPQIAAGPGGAPTVVWKRQTIDANDPDSDADDVVTDTLVASVDGGAPQTLRSTTTASIGGSAVDETPDGTAAVAWDESEGAASAVRASLRAPGGAFGSSEVVSTGGLLNRVSDPRVAIRAPAQPVLIWLRRSPAAAVDTLEGAVRDAGWSPVAVPADVDVEEHSLDADGEGNVVGAWSAAGGDVRIAAYDAVAPRFDALTVPAGAEAGARVPMSVAVSDTWSAVPTLHWDFGDGATGDGASVEHAYAEDGTYTISVTARDAAGNEAVSPNAQIRIAQGATAPPPEPPAPAARDQISPQASGLALDPRCIPAGGGRSVTATFSLSEDAQVLYSIRRRRESKPRSTCPGPVTRKVPGTSEEIGSQIGTGTTGTNVATLARARRGARTVHGRARRGRNRVRLAQLVNSLPPGTYQVVVRATDAAGNRSVDMIAKFWVLAPNDR